MAADNENGDNSPQGHIHSKPEQDLDEVMRLFMKAQLAGEDKLNISQHDPQAFDPLIGTGEPPGSQQQDVSQGIVAAINNLAEAIRGQQMPFGGGQAEQKEGDKPPAPLPPESKPPPPSFIHNPFEPVDDEPKDTETKPEEPPPPPPPPASQWTDTDLMQALSGGGLPQWFGADKMPPEMQETMGKADDYQPIITHVEQFFDSERKFRRTLLMLLEKAIHDLYQDHARLEDIERYFEGMRTTL